MELKKYFLPLIRYWWLLVIAAVVAFASSFLVARRQPPIYQTRSTLVIGRAVYESNPNSNDFWLTQQLASYYADIAARQQVRDATMKALGLEWLPEYVARPLPNSQLIEIVVQDINPLRAQAVANELANQLILQSPTSAQKQDQGHQEFIDKQLYQLETKITETQDEIAKKQEEVGDLTSARDIANAQEDLNALTTKLTTLQTNYANLLANSGQGATNTLTVIEQASLPTVPVGPNKMMIVLMATVLAVGIAAAAAYLLDFLDDTLKAPEDVTRLVDAPIIGYLSEMGKQDDGIYVAKQPRSFVAEAFRSLRINLEFMGVDRPLKTLLVTSAGMGDGKTSVASNLAVIMAQGGKRVILLDADLRRPKLHKTFGLPNDQGLSDLFRGQADLTSVSHAWDRNLTVITGGPPPPNPSDLLGSKKMNAILETLEDKADFVIVDGPPLIVADSVVMGSKVDGVLMVIRYSYTRRDAVKKSVENLERAGAKILGIALNSLPRSAEGYYGRYGYYANTDDPGEGGAITTNGSKPGVKAGRDWLAKLPGRPRKGGKHSSDAARIEDAGID